VHLGKWALGLRFGQSFGPKLSLRFIMRKQEASGLARGGSLTRAEADYRFDNGLATGRLP
jgi:hypothetical protein